MSTSPSTSTCRPNGELKKIEESVPDKTQLDAILKKLECIDSKITTLNDCHAEGRRLLNKLRQMEANFRLLFHASRSEIAKLKCQIHKDPSHSTTNRHGNPPKVDPLQPISDSEIISLLHCPSDISFIQSEISIPYSKRIATTTSSQSSSTISSSSSESSSLSSSSSNSSPLSSDSSPHQSPEVNYRSPENHSNNQTPAIPADKPVESRPSKKRENAGSKDVATELANGTEGHLMRLFSASVRNARDHHAYSVMNAPPSRGHIPDANEKAEMDKYYDNMEAEKVKSCPPYPDDEEGDHWHHNEKMDMEEITEEESAGGNFDEPRNIHRSNDSPHIDVEEHVSDIDSHKSYADRIQEGAISEGEIYDDLDEDPATGDNDRNRGGRGGTRKRVQRRSSTPRNYHQGNRPRNPRYDSSGGRNRYETPVHARRTLPSSSSSGEPRRFSHRNSNEFSRNHQAKRPRRSEDDDSHNTSPPQKRRLPPPSGRNSSPRNTSSRGGGHFGNSRSFQRQRTSSPQAYTASSSPDRHRHRNRSYKRQH